MLEVVHSSDVVVVSLKLHIRIDEGESIGSSLHLWKPRLMGLEEEAIHVGQLNFVIVKQEKLSRILKGLEFMHTCDYKDVMIPTFPIPQRVSISAVTLPTPPTPTTATV